MKKLTQRKAAKVLGIPQACISLYESGQTTADRRSAMRLHERTAGFISYPHWDIEVPEEHTQLFDQLVAELRSRLAPIPGGRVSATASPPNLGGYLRHQWVRHSLLYSPDDHLSEQAALRELLGVQPRLTDIERHQLFGGRVLCPLEAA